MVSNICLKTFRAACTVMAVAATAFANDQIDLSPRDGHWSLARAREWGQANPWYCGFNHVPANAINDVEACHRDDPRIFMWDLYNEPTNCMQQDRKKYAIDLMRKCFRWAREIGPSQPLTVACWHPNDPKFDEIALAESDIVTFHCYGNAATTRKKIAAMSAPGRPVICTEWLYRPSGCDIPNVLCIYKETGVGCMLWGLVNGKAQTHIPNGRFTANYKGPWKHDLFYSDHRPYSVRDLELIRAATGAPTKDNRK